MTASRLFAMSAAALAALSLHGCGGGGGGGPNECDYSGADTVGTKKHVVDLVPTTIEAHGPLDLTVKVVSDADNSTISYTGKDKAIKDFNITQKKSELRLEVTSQCAGPNERVKAEVTISQSVHDLKAYNGAHAIAHEVLGKIHAYMGSTITVQDWGADGSESTVDAHNGSVVTVASLKAMGKGKNRMYIRDKSHVSIQSESPESRHKQAIALTVTGASVAEVQATTDELTVNAANASSVTFNKTAKVYITADGDCELHIQNVTEKTVECSAGKVMDINGPGEIVAPKDAASDKNCKSSDLFTGAIVV